MKILQINAVYGMGSTGKIVRDISDKLLEQGHESYVMWAISCRKDNRKVNLLRIGNTLDHKLHALLRRLDGGQGLHSKFATKQACKKILEIAPDVVHLHNLHSNYIHIPTLLAFFAEHDIPVLLTLHDCWFFTGYCPYYKNENDCQQWLSGCEDCPAVGKHLRKNVKNIFAERKNLYCAIKNLAVNGVSKWTTDAARNSVLKTATHIQCVYNWIDTEQFQPKDTQRLVKRKYGISEGRKLILGVSQLWSNKKGLDSFIALADMLSDRVEILLVGEDGGIPERDNLRGIGFTSNVQELIDLYSAADVFVNPSNAETFGLVTVEAMACGTPVVAYDNSGSSELVTPACGILVEDGNKDALADGVRTVLERGKVAYSEACRDYVCKNFEKNKQLQEYIDFYQKIASTGSSAGGKGN